MPRFVVPLSVTLPHAPRPTPVRKSPAAHCDCLPFPARSALRWERRSPAPLTAHSV